MCHYASNVKRPNLGPRIDLAIALIDRMKKLFATTKGIADAFETIVIVAVLTDSEE